MTLPPLNQRGIALLASSIKAIAAAVAVAVFAHLGVELWVGRVASSSSSISNQLTVTRD